MAEREVSTFLAWVRFPVGALFNFHKTCYDLLFLNNKLYIVPYK